VEPGALRSAMLFVQALEPARAVLRSWPMPPIYKDPAMLLLVVTAAATAFFAVYMAI
jgi:hypothetical protein